MKEVTNIDYDGEVLEIVDEEARESSKTANEKAEAAQSTADTAKANAATAQAAAEAAQSTADTATNIAKGRNQAHVFNTTADMQAWLSNADNKGLWSKGDNIYIVELDVPDWWVAEVLTTADPDTGYYYKIAQLETQKVDLTNYLSQSDVVDNLNSTATKAPLSANQGRLLSENLATKNLITYTNVTQLGLTLDNTLDEIFSAMPSLSQLVVLIQQGKTLGGSLPNSNTAELIVTKGNHERGIAVRTQYANGSRQINHCYGGEWKGWETLATKTELDTKMPKSGGETTGQMQFIRNLGVTNVSYSQAGVSMIAPTNESASARAGIGFTNEGSNGAYLYLDTDGKLKYMNDAGEKYIITATKES